MPTTILQATVGAGKTEAALNRLSECLSQPFAKAWVLLATKRQEVAFRQRLIDLNDGRAVYFNAEFFNFYELNARLLNLAGQPPRRINEPARLGLLRKILGDLHQARRLPTFAPIVRTTGFLRVMADLIYELKQNRVYPDIFEKAAKTQKDRELALIYTSYQDFVQRENLVDLEGEGWLALEAVENHLHLGLDVSLLLIDGYDQFTPVQAALLAQLSGRVGETIVTLTKAPDERDEREKTVIGRRFVQARNRIIEEHRLIGAECKVINQDEPRIDKHEDLAALARNIFSEKAPVESKGGIRLLEAPEPIHEVAAVLREVKRMLLKGVRPDDMLLALRDWPRYHSYIDMYTRLYELPLLLHYGEPLVKNPAITVLMNILALPSKNPNSPMAFRRRDVLDALRSPYVHVPGFTPERIDWLEKICQQKQVLGGKANWLVAIESSSEGSYDDEDNFIEPILDMKTGMELSTDLETFFNQISPPARATHQTYVSWLEELIGQDTLDDPDDIQPEDYATQFDDAYSLNLPQCIRAIESESSERIINRDTTALNQFKELLRGMLSTQEFLRSTLGDNPLQVAWEDFFADIQSGVKNSIPQQHSPIRSGRVLVTTATEARGLPHEHLFILGLSEGIFPAELPEDPIYLDSERLAQRPLGVLLQTQAERADDNGIFYELISQARQSLTLSRPHVRDGKHWVESHLWRMTRSVFTNLVPQYIGIGQVVPADDVASIDEAVLALADGLSDGEAQALMPLYQWMMQANSPYWRQIEHGRDTEKRRFSKSPHDEYSGRLFNPNLIEIVANTINKNYVWSATRLNAYGTCPYRFFAGYLLQLEEIKPPQEGLDALQMGSLNHKILEQTYQAILDEGFIISSDYHNDALEILEEKAITAFRSAPQDFQFRASSLWREEQRMILRRLKLLVSKDFSDESPLNKLGRERRPFALEQKFGYEDRLRIPIGNEYIRVRGSIDRIDISEDRLILMDYKTGSSKIDTKELEEGRNFQMMVYLLALKEMLKAENSDLSIAGGMFWHIRNQEHSGLIAVEEDVQAVESIQKGQTHLSHYLKQIREGNFAEVPNKITDGRCSAYCEFYQLCRLANTNPYKD
jgi:ATP-dependent helicase/nuclease subunit B